MNKNQYINAFLVSVSLFVASCSPKVESRGYVLQDSWKDQIKIGQSTKEDVLDKFGSPSAQSSFGAETWYYVSSRKEGIAFMRPEVVEQDVVNITFDSTGIVTAVNLYDENSSKEFDLVKRTTPTEGHSLSFIDQTLGNLGRFNRPGGRSGSTLSGGGRNPTNGGY